MKGSSTSGVSPKLPHPKAVSQMFLGYRASHSPLCDGIATEIPER